jgi:hypothetical protein
MNKDYSGSQMMGQRELLLTMTAAIIALFLKVGFLSKKNM